LADHPVAMVGAVALRPGQLLAGEDDDVLSIADLYDEVEAALGRAFPRQREVWVRGEIQHVADQHARRGHCYLDLVDPESAGERQAPVLRVKCWQSTWGPLRAVLGREGIELQPGMVVVLRGTLDFYRPKAEIGFILAELDVTALLGRLAAQRAALLRTLTAEGMLERNRSRPVPPVPLRIGLVASPGTEGYRDFVGQLTGSGFGFCVRVVPTTVQGPEAPMALAASLHSLSALGPGELDLVVVVRGGGSKADLAAFDTEPVARAIAGCSVPVWTGIGHTGDESVADIVANRSCITPTDCGQELAQRVARWWEGVVVVTAAVIARRAEEAVAGSEHERARARDRLVAMARHLVDRQADHLTARVDALVRCGPRVVDDARAMVVSRGARLGPLALAHVERSADRLGSWRRLLTAYDVERQLERGYSLTLGADGRVVRTVASLAPGARILTRFADGTAGSTVETVHRAGMAATAETAARDARPRDDRVHDRVEA
jgi:exodeoxyribonuclease VII large subunit